MKPIVVGLLLLLAGCATDSPEAENTAPDDDAADDSGGSPTTHAIDIAGFKFDASELTISVGDTVVWTNQDSAAHTVDSTDGGALDSGNLGQGATYSFTFTEAGSFAYHCAIHPSMTGQIIVAS